MNSALLLSVLKGLIPIAEPLILQEFENVVKPELDKLASGGSADWVVIKKALEQAGITIGETEIPKILKLAV